MLIRFLSILLRIAFVTILERKLLRYSQNRVGPNKVLILGLLQPVLDGVKLIFKEIIFIRKRNTSIFYMAPFVSLFIMLILWVVVPNIYFTLSLRLSFLIIIVFIGISVYPTILIGWASNRKYRVIGSIRSCAQSIRYEISISILIFSFIIRVSRFNTTNLQIYAMRIILINFPIIIIWFLSCVAECNRAPFDFAEGESELVSGFNVEYGSGRFAVIFVSEYGIIILFSIISGFLFIVRSVRFLPTFITFLSLIIFIRSAYPRFKYDKLIHLAWLKLLPIRLFALFMLILTI